MPDPTYAELVDANRRLLAAMHAAGVSMQSYEQSMQQAMTMIAALRDRNDALTLMLAKLLVVQSTKES